MAMGSPDIAAPGSSTSGHMRFDVFLSYVELDTRQIFTDHLYAALVRKGIVTFRDDEEIIKRGDSIMEELFEAIEQSRIAIVVLSKNYIASAWCLEELLRIMESKYNEGETIFPVFYGIDPSDLRDQRGSIAAAFENHAKLSVDEVRRWKEALTKIAELPSIWVSRDRYEVELIEDLTESVWKKLYNRSPSDFDYPVGDIFNRLVGDIQSKVDEIISLSKIGLDDICFVGICGMGGVGKTTLARVVYEAVHRKFDASCFLSNIREVSERRGFAFLQRRLLFNVSHDLQISDSLEGASLIRHFLRHKKVLIILDDVSDKSQLENLAGSEEWFGPGSKIIITTRDKSLLTVYKRFEIYEVGPLDQDESLKLFCQRAFNKNEPEQGYLDLSKEIIERVRGVPLPLEVMGSFLYGKTQSEWRNTLDRLTERSSNETIISVLRRSYDVLEDECKMIFLDIACFFNGRTKFEVRNILKTCYVRPIYGIERLIEASLLSSTQLNSNSRHNAEEGQDMYDRLQKMRSDIFLPTFMYHKLLNVASHESLLMHDLLQEMGRKIVFDESPSDAGRRSRLWNIEDIDYVLKENEGTGKVESIVLDLPHPFKAVWGSECFSKMQNLRLLDLSRVELDHNLSYLPRALKFLRWDCYDFESLPPVGQLRELESIQLRCSNLKTLWDGSPELSKLRTIDLSYSHDIMETPDFSGTPNLEKLFLDHCISLEQVHESVGQLKKLVELSLAHCISLETLPTCLDMNNLEVFILNHCSKLQKLPDFGVNMRRLYFVDVMNTQITWVPSSIINLEKLKYLDLSGCRKLQSIPELPPNSIIRADKDSSLAPTFDLQHLIESKHPSVADHPIHFVFDLKGKEDMPPWFEQRELRRSKDELGEVVTITADIPSDLANSEGECWGIAVCIIFECPSEEVWRGFAIDWTFQDYPHTDDKKGGRPLQTHADAGLETECRVYKGFFPIDKEKCRQRPSGEGSQVDLTLCFPTTNTIGKVNIHSKETSSGDLEIVHGGWRLVCNKDLDASSARIWYATAQSSPINAGRRSRLWSLEDIDLVLKENKGTKHVQGIVLKTQQDFKVDWDPNCFSKLINLRFLDLSKVYLLTNLESLPTSLKVLRWDYYSWDFLPSIKNLCNLESLQLCNSRIKTLWEGNPSLYKLRIIDMSGSESVSETPDFSGTPNLEELLLNGCISLTKVHESVAKLEKLVKLSLRDCIILEDLPDKLETNSLQEFILTGCIRLHKLPNFGEGMTSLYFLDVSDTDITKIPSSIKYLINLKILDLWNCEGLKSLPAVLPRLIVCASNSLALKPAIAQLNLSASRPKRPGDLQGPLHSFGGLRAGATISEWFERSEYCWGKDMSGEFVTITARIPPNVADSNEECWGIAVCLFLKTFSQASQSYIDWSFKDQRDANNKTKMHGNLSPDDDDWGFYVGFFHFVKEQCRLHPTPNGGEAYKLDLTISFLAINANRDLRDLAIMGCQWRLASKFDFDNRERGESTNSVAERNALIHSKETTVPDLEIVDRGSRLVRKKILEATSKKILDARRNSILDARRKKILDARSERIRNETKSERRRKNERDGLSQWCPREVRLRESMSCRKKKKPSITSKVGFQFRHEAEIAEDILGDELRPSYEHSVEDTKSKVDRIISLLKMGLDETCFIGIWGERGIGKTTLARLVYDEIQSKFDATCFLDNIREVSERVGIDSLQKKLLSGLRLGERDIDDSFEGANIIRKFLCHKKVLIILDDVSQISQLENLARNKEWFGAGSKIVITTRDKTLLTMYERFEEYGVGRLHPDESLKLLCQEAFKKDEPQEGYWDLAQEVIKHVCGFPLVLKVLGSYLCKKDKNEWRKASERLRENSPADISGQLRISYDGLENEEYKRIFLDVACFFNWEPKFKVTNMLELCGHHGTNGVEVLIEKSMLNVNRSNSDLWQNAKEDQDMLGRIQKLRSEIFLPTYLYDWLVQEASKEYLYMHDLLQVMGRNIVFQESNAGRRSRLWSPGEINDVLKGNMGDGNVESIVLHMQESFEADWHPDCFSNMEELRLLDLSKVRLSRNLNFLPSALKIMSWDYYALESLPPVGQLHELKSLRLCKSKIRKLWNGAPALDMLRIIDLSDSKCLEIPDFSGTPNLEELLLNRCRKLVQVHKSVGQLKKLVKLNLQECRRLESLPTLQTDKLEELILSGCLKLKKLPEFGRNMGNLYFLDVRGTNITEIRRSIIRLSHLKCLDLTFCSRLKSVPKLPPNLIISASNCRLLEPTSALPHLYASCVPKGPIHLFYDFQLWTRIPTWFEQWEYCWGKDNDGPTSGEFVTITADIPSNVVADSNEEHWGIAVCVVFQFLSKAWLGFSVNWKFEDKCHPKKTKIHGTPAYYVHDCRVYMGFYPFEAKDCRQHASGEGSQLDLTLEFPATNIIKGLHDLEIMGCGWRLACKKDFDEWSENRAPSPLRLDFLNRDRGESSDNTIPEGKRKRKHQEIVH